MIASDLISMIAARHTDDLFVPECKDGQTYGRHHFRLDAWAMKRSYSRPCLSGYEVKVSRSDFLNDDKAQEYLKLCNQFWFACPRGMIQPEELPEGSGLLWAGEKRLIVKRKAPYRPIDTPTPLYEYVLMSRATIKGRHAMDGDDAAVLKAARADVFRKMVRDRKESKMLGYMVSQKIVAELGERQRRINRLQSYRSHTKALEALLRKMGYDPDALDGDGTYMEWSGRKKIEAMKNDVDAVRHAASCMIDQLTAFVGECDKSMVLTHGKEDSGHDTDVR